MLRSDAYFAAAAERDFEILVDFFDFFFGEDEASESELEGGGETLDVVDVGGRSDSDSEDDDMGVVSL